MSSAQLSAEWVFGDIINYFKVLNFWKIPQDKIESCAQNVYCLCVSSHCKKLLLWNIGGHFFGIQPPLIGAEVNKLNPNIKKKHWKQI